MISWLRRFFAPEEVYVVFTAHSIPVSAHTTEQGATEDTGTDGYTLGGIPLIID